MFQSASKDFDHSARFLRGFLRFFKFFPRHFKFCLRRGSGSIGDVALLARRCKIG